MPRPKKSSYANEKPPLSYVALCAMAIRSSSTGMMSLNEIYRFIVNTFPYYKNTCSKWRNSLRHNLSFNDCFVKIVQGSKNGHKRSLWSLHPNCGDMFEDGSLLRRKRRFTTNNMRQKEDGSSFKTRQPSKVEEANLVPNVGQNEDLLDKMSRLREVFQTRDDNQMHTETEPTNMSLLSDARKSRLTNFTIENILRESFPPQKRDIHKNQRYIEKNSLFVPNKNQCDSRQCFDQIFQNCICGEIANSYRHRIEVPVQEFYCPDYPPISQYTRSFGYNQTLLKSNRETFTLHYKARWS